MERLKWWISSRAHRIEQVDCDPSRFELVLQEAMLFGYPRKVVLSAASVFRKFDFVRVALRSATSTSRSAKQR